jgi:GT2 family glycosyltransferase
MEVNIIILNYNGRGLLEKYLPAAIEASENSTHKCCVTVLDNNSNDGSTEYVKNNFPTVRIYRAKENKVYCSFNELAISSSEDIIIVLNNDMRLDKNFIDPLIRHFEQDNNVFFVASHGDRSIACFQNGILQPLLGYDGYDELLDNPGYAFSAGIGAFDRKKFVQLEGFDELYLPGRFEDVDLCFRGWKAGYKGIYEPQSLQYHEGAASFNKKYTSHQISALVFRNEIIFTIKNITDIFFFLKFIPFLFLRASWYLVTGRFYMLKAMFEASRRLNIALSARRKAKKHFKLTDRKVIYGVNQEYYDFIKTKPITVRFAKRFVRMLYAQNSFIRGIFFSLGFFTLRLFKPLEYHILRELMDCSSV